jgi:protocatechuate 3,4-dioxygenase beta subunit
MHLHLAIRSGTTRLVTQLYFAAAPHLAGDPTFALLGDAGARHAAAERGFAVEIVTDGPQATFFE